ncbi:MAG: DUF6285 domain-containing protein, partial [Pseudomonadota bacterium]|nr:DUF6285 domain-containing protein [Pseudomonadota bacterium]
MSQDRPPIDNILATVRRFLDACVPRLEGEMRYHAQVASYLLAIGERELRLGSTFDAEEQALLAGFVTRDGSAAELNADLAAGLRAGRLDDAFPQVLEVLLARAVHR